MCMREERYGREREREVSESSPGQGRRDTYFDVSPQLSLPLRRLCCCQIHRKRKCCFSSLALLFSLSFSSTHTPAHTYTLFLFNHLYLFSNSTPGGLRYISNLRGWYYRRAGEDKVSGCGRALSSLGESERSMPVWRECVRGREKGQTVTHNFIRVYLHELNI